MVRSQKESGERSIDDNGYGWTETFADRPTWIANGSLTRSPESGLQLGVHGYYASAHDGFIYGMQANPLGGPPLPLRIQPMTIVNLHLGYKFWFDADGWVEVALTVQNLLDTDEREDPGGVQQGLYADGYRRDPYDFDPPRAPVDVAYGGERHRRSVVGMIRGAY